MSTTVQDCQMAKILLKKFGYLEKRVTYLEEKSRGQEKLIQKFKIKLKKLKMRNRNQVGQSSQVDCVEPVGESSHEEFDETTDDVKPDLIEVTGSMQNEQELETLKPDEKLSQKLIVNLGVRCSEKIQEFANASPEKSVERDQRCTTKKVHQNVETGGKSSKPKIKRKKTYICTFCSKSSGSFEDLSRHMRVHTGERPFKCQICSKSFKHMDHLKRHSYIHKDEKPFSCSVCSKSFIQFKSLQYHHMTIHKGIIFHPQLSKPKGPVKKARICTFCSKSFNCFEHLSRHMRVHTGERPYKCEICPKSFSLMSNLKRHTQGHTGEKPFSCSICSKSIQSSNLQYHMRIHKVGQSGQVSVDCEDEEPVGESSQEEFDETTVDVKLNLIEMAESMQNEQELDTLKHDEKLSQKLIVNLGVRCSEKIQELANSSSGKSAEIDRRSKISQTKTKRAHQNTISKTGVKSSKPKRTWKKTHICTFCSKSFRYFSHLSDHMRVHTGERPFKCEICSKSFTTMSNLRYHTRLHTGEKPYSCSVCSKTFAYTLLLKYHMSKHFGTYSCSICSKIFGSKFNLKIHKATHTGERPYKCTNCNKKFIRLSVLVCHRKNNLNCQQE